MVSLAETSTDGDTRAALGMIAARLRVAIYLEPCDRPEVSTHSNEAVIVQFAEAPERGLSCTAVRVGARPRVVHVEVTEWPQ